MAKKTTLQVHPLRLRPGQDLYESLAELTKTLEWEAAIVLTCVGSLTRVTMRFADCDETRTLEGPFEIVSLTGTLSPDGVHLHISVADENGITQGGHLKPDSLIYTTAELVLGHLDGTKFKRKNDAETGFKELLILT